MSVTMKNTVFCGVTLCGLVGTYKHFGGSCYHHHQGRRTNPETEGRFLQDIGWFLPDYRAQHPKTMKGHHTENTSYNCDNTTAKFFAQGFTVT